MKGKSPLAFERGQISVLYDLIGGKIERVSSDAGQGRSSNNNIG